MKILFLCLLKRSESKWYKYGRAGKRIVKNLEIKAKSIYDDYDESKIGSQQYFVVQAVRYLELVSKILPNFNHDLKKEENWRL